MKQTIARNLGCASGLGWILLVAGLLFLSALLWNQVRLAVWGKTAEGIVTEVTTRVSYGSSPRKSGESLESYHQRTGATVSHDLHIRFTTESGVTTDIVTLSTFGHELREGDRVKLIYLPADPARAEIHSVKQLWLPMIVGFVVSVTCLGGGFYLRRTVRSLA